MVPFFSVGVTYVVCVAGLTVSQQQSVCIIGITDKQDLILPAETTVQTYPRSGVIKTIIILCYDKFR